MARTGDVAAQDAATLTGWGKGGVSICSMQGRPMPKPLGDDAEDAGSEVSRARERSQVPGRVNMLIPLHKQQKTEREHTSPESALGISAFQRWKFTSSQPTLRLVCPYSDPRAGPAEGFFILPPFRYPADVVIELRCGIVSLFRPRVLAFRSVVVLVDSHASIHSDY